MKTKVNTLAPIVVLNDETTDKIREAIEDLNRALYEASDAASTLYSLIDNIDAATDECINPRSAKQSELLDALNEQLETLRDELQNIDVPNEVEESVLDNFIDTQTELNDAIERANKRSARKQTKRTTKRSKR